MNSYHKGPQSTKRSAKTAQIINQLSDWQAYVEAVKIRLDAGQREYGDKSFRRSPITLIEEIRQELRDVSGWAFILDCRLARVADTLAEIESRIKQRAGGKACQLASMTNFTAPKKAQRPRLSKA